MTPSLAQLTAQVDKLANELNQRAGRHRTLDSYYDGASPFPVAIKQAKVTQAYRRLMPVADAPWGSLIVGSVLDRLEVGGIRDTDQSAADAVWKLWQQNHMDSESILAHESGLITGRAFALVWPNQDTGDPEISLDSSDQMVIQYEEGSRHNRRAALRRWKDDDTGKTMATLYRPEGIYKFQEPASQNSQQGNWEMRQVDGEDWPVKNPWDVVPVVEIRFNPRLRAGVFAHARGEYAHCLGVIDRINLLTFLGLVVAFWMGFPLRALIGDKILRDDDNNVIAPFEATADTVIQLENPDAKLDAYAAADRSNLAVYPELAQLAAITKTPRHYFPLAQAMANLSADAIRADEGALNAKVVKHKGSAGEGWGEVHRLCGLMNETPLSPNAQVIWQDHESRSLAERADAASKLSPILPWQALVERVLNASQDDIARWETMRSSEALTKLVVAASQPSTVDTTGDETPAPAPG